MEVNLVLATRQYIHIMSSHICIPSDDILPTPPFWYQQRFHIVSVLVNFCGRLRRHGTNVDSASWLCRECTEASGWVRPNPRRNWPAQQKSGVIFVLVFFISLKNIENNNNNDNEISLLTTEGYALSTSPYNPVTDWTWLIKFMLCLSESSQIRCIHFRLCFSHWFTLPKFIDSRCLSQGFCSGGISRPGTLTYSVILFWGLQIELADKFPIQYGKCQLPNSVMTWKAAWKFMRKLIMKSLTSCLPTLPIKNQQNVARYRYTSIPVPWIRHGIFKIYVYMICLERKWPIYIYMYIYIYIFFFFWRFDS